MTALPRDRRLVLSLGENARQVLEARYLRRDAGGELEESPEQLIARVARAMAEVEVSHELRESHRAHSHERENLYYNLMASGSFLPNSPTLLNAGRAQGMLSACFVLPVGDSIEKIFDAVKLQALIQKAGGGTGFDFSEIRPKGDRIQSGGSSPGPLAFMQVFSESSKAIQQGAFRRGANMGILHIRHPDIVEFIEVKSERSRLINFNISVAVDDAFFNELQRAPDEPHEVLNPNGGARKKLGLSRREIFRLICRRACDSGEPGLVFLDRVNATQPTPEIGAIRATNPCGEQPLLAYESCNLGSINLSKFCRGPALKTTFDWESFEEACRLGARFLDNVVDANAFPSPLLHEAAHLTRKIGLGVMGFADALFLMGIPYASEEAVLLGEKIMRRLKEAAQGESEKMAAERGVFPAWAASRWAKEWGGRRLRNACVTTIAPTGTLSILASCSAGIEPLFSLSFTRQILDGRRLTEVNPIFVAVARERGFYSEQLMKKVATAGSLSGIAEVPADIAQIFQCAHDVAPEWHVRHQAAFQKHSDSAVSKTVNLPHSARPDDVEKIYLLAYESGCKGITVYRDGCRDTQPMARTPTE